MVLFAFIVASPQPHSIIHVTERKERSRGLNRGPISGGGFMLTMRMVLRMTQGAGGPEDVSTVRRTAAVRKPSRLQTKRVPMRKQVAKKQRRQTRRGYLEEGHHRGRCREGRCEGQQEVEHQGGHGGGQRCLLEPCGSGRVGGGRGHHVEIMTLDI